MVLSWSRRIVIAFASAELADVSTRAEIVESEREFPQNKCIVEAVGDGSATVKHEVGSHELRPGGTVSGPVLMTVADMALYVALLGEIVGSFRWR